MITEFFSESDYFNAAKTRGVKARRVEREDYGDSAVGYVELRREGSFCDVRGRVCPEHRVNNKTYAVSIMVDEENESIGRVTCEDCAASAGGCKHVVAFLMWVHRMLHRCHISVASNVRSLKAKDMRTPKVPEYLPYNTAFFKTISDEMQKRKFDSRISPHYIYQNSTKVLSLHNMMLDFCSSSDNGDVQSFLKFASEIMTEERCIQARKRTKNQSECKLWNELRYGRITASRLYRMAHCKTKNGWLIERVIGNLNIRDTKAMERGRRLEKNVIKLMKEILKTDIEDCGLLLDSRFPVIGASPDGVGNDFVVEIKCPSTPKTEYKYITRNNRVASKCLAQIQLQMFLKNVKKGYFCVATHDFETSRAIKLICVEYDEDFLLDLIEKAMAFWQDNIYPLIIQSAKSR